MTMRQAQITSSQPSAAIVKQYLDTSYHGLSKFFEKISPTREKKKCIVMHILS